MVSSLACSLHEIEARQKKYRHNANAGSHKPIEATSDDSSCIGPFPF